MVSPITLVSEAVPREQRTGDGITTDFPVTSWGVKDTEHLRVLFGEPGNEPSIAYSVHEVDDSEGFTVEFDTPPPAGTLITFIRRTPDIRDEDYGQEKAFVAAVVNAELAGIMLRIQEVRTEALRALRLADTDTSSVPFSLPGRAARASKALGFDADGRPVPLALAAGDPVLDFDVLPSATALSGSDLFAVDQEGGTVKAPLSLVAAYLTALAIGLPIITSQNLGMVGDWDGSTGTDDAPALQRGYDAYGGSALTRGATFMLRAQPGRGFYFAGRPRGGSNVNTIFVSPVAVAPKVGLDLKGRYSSAAVADAKLLADGVEGAFTCRPDTAPMGGGPLSTYFSAGDVVELRGLRDSAGTLLEQQVARVTARDDGTGDLTLAQALDNAYAVTYPHGAYWAGWELENETRIRVTRSSELTVSTTEGSDTVTCDAATVGRLVVGDWVLLEDEKVQSDVAGSATGRIHREIARIRGIVSTAVTLNRRVSRVYETAYHARLVAIDPIRGATIQGAVIEYAGAASADLDPAIKMELATECTVGGCRVPNADNFGARGPAFEARLSFGSDFVECEAANPKFFDSGEGYGFFLTSATACNVRACVATGCRHSIVWKGSTDCNAYDFRSVDCRIADLDWHGADEYGCTAYNPEVWGGTDSSNAFAFGNSTGLNGCRQCGVQGGEVQRYQKTDSYAIAFEPSVKSCYVRGVSFRQIFQLFHHVDVPGFGGLIAEDCLISSCTIDGCADFVAEIRGGNNGSLNRTSKNLQIVDCKFRNLTKLVYVNQAEGFVLRNCSFEQITPDATFSYSLYLLNVLNGVAEGNTFKGASRGIRTQDSTWKVIANHFLDQVNATVFDDLGGCTSSEWIENIYSGFVWTSSRNGSVLIESPRLSGPVTVADDAVFTIKPPRPRGRCTIISGDSRLKYLTYWFNTGAVAPEQVDKIGSSTVAYTATALVGTTGTDTNITIGRFSDGYLYFENRTGSAYAIEDMLWS